jgi:hypothetical protein
MRPRSNRPSAAANAKAEDYFRERAQRGNIGKAKRLLKRAGRGNAPVPGDELK